VQATSTLLPSWAAAPRAVVGVCPTSAFHERRRLFHALERVLPVEFAPRPEGDWRGLQALILFGKDTGFIERVNAGRLPAFMVEEQRVYAGEAGHMVRFADTGRLDRKLRGQQMESVLTGIGLARDGVDHVDLATIGDCPLWQTSRTAPRVDRVAVPPPELKSRESVRDHLRAGRYLELLPLFDFLGELTGHGRGNGPVRATFIIDDPNLHWRSYGYVGFRSLAAHARANGYHVTFATVPLDCWFAWPGAARIFRANGDVLSLTSHGAYHLYSELAAGSSGRGSSALFEDAAARLDRFANRWGVPVGRVMVPPHGMSALCVHDALVGAGFEALCTTLGWWADWPDDQASIAGIAVADVSPAGLPVFARHCLPGRFAREDALISAYLGQPVVLYGHPQDLSDGYNLLEVAASWLGSVSPTVWRALEWIARTNVVTHVDVPTATLHLKVLNRHCNVVAPAGARKASIEGPGSGDSVGCIRSAGAMCRVHATAIGWRSDEHIPCEAGHTLEVMIGDTFRDHARRRPTIAPLRAYARRAAVETRDRLHPILRRLGLESLAATVEEVFRARRKAALHARKRRRIRDAA
jgi:hypothetical protein